jgi:rRNA maturation RNase YbeY
MLLSGIRFFTDDITYSLRHRSEVRRWLQRVAKQHHHKIADLNYIFVSDKRILDINRQFLDHDTYTDIITFPGSNGGNRLSGEIYISVDRVRENAKEFGSSLTDELHRVMAHGLLHLCGFKDKTPREQRLMRGQEEKALDLRTF